MASKKHNHRVLKMKLVFCIIVFLFSSSCIPNFQDNKPSVTSVTHYIESNQKLAELWNRKIHIIGDHFGIPCVAFGSSVFLLNKEDTKKNLQLISIESKEGKTNWTTEGSFPIIIGDSQILLGAGQKVVSLSPENGIVNWTTFLLEARHVGEMYYFDGLLYVNSSGFPFFILDPKKGQVLSKYTSVDSFREKHPSVPFYPNLNFQPTKFKDDIILNYGDIVYTITRENLKNPQIKWEISIDSISNSVIIGEEIFYISKDSKIKIIDANTGVLNQEIQITPSIDFFNLDKNVQHEGYFLCSEGDEKKLYMVLGDSQQMFAFQVN